MDARRIRTASDVLAARSESECVHQHANKMGHVEDRFHLSKKTVSSTWSICTSDIFDMSSLGRLSDIPQALPLPLQIHRDLADGDYAVHTVLESLSPMPSTPIVPRCQAARTLPFDSPAARGHHAAPASPSMFHKARSGVGHGRSMDHSLQALRCTPLSGCASCSSFRIREPGASIELSH